MKPSSRLILVLGSGGVGKTSTSAALGLALAQKGFRCAVITIDPAKRLAQALGLETLSIEPQRVFESDNAYLDALWLDSKSAFTDLVNRQIKNPELVEKILNNRLFKIIQDQLGGIEEYLSIDRLLRLGQSGLYDICILDTPPSRHALDFIESPRHLLKFFDDSVLKIFIGEAPEDKSKNVFSRLFQSTRSQALEIFKKFLGASFMGELSKLLTQSRPVHDSLLRTATDAEAWVKESSTLSILVSTPEQYPLEEAHLLSSELLAHDLHKADLLLLNRCLPTDPIPPDLDLKKLLGAPSFEHLQTQHQKQTELIGKLKTELTKYALHSVYLPRFSNSKMSLSTLNTLGKDLITQWETARPNLFSTN